MKYAFFIILFSTACSTQEDKSTVVSVDDHFNTYKESFIENLWRYNPVQASSMGYHRYDSVLIVADSASREAELEFVNAQMDSLQNFDPMDLSSNNRTDFYMIQNQLDWTKWNTNDYRGYEWDPSTYNVTGTFSEMLNNNYDSLNTRLHNFYLRMKNVPAYYEAAKRNIKNPTPEHTALAIEQNLGSVSVFESDLKLALDSSTISTEEQEQILTRAKSSADAVRGYAAWLKDLKDTDKTRSFRLGSTLYNRKFELEIQSGYTIEEVYQKAILHKKELHDKMAALANQLWSEYMGNTTKPSDTLKLIRAVIDKLSLKHVRRDSFQIAIEQQIPVLTAFVKDKNLLYMDPSKPLVVRKEPAYMAGVAGASISAPGPYDKTGNTYYNVGSLNGWPKEQAESYLREYNQYTLQILNIHEAIPGHYAQLIYSNLSPSIVKAILGNGAMIEGWAVYAELMMLENGYGNNSPEMWMMYYKWNLRTTCNIILDYSVHTKNMSKEDAMHLLVDEGFQQKAEAEGKWKRVSLTQVQLCSYFTGYEEIYELREEIKKKIGDAFDLKQFHEKFLSYGSAPVKYIKAMMLAESVKSDGADSVKSGNN